MYYLRTRAAADAIKFTVDQQALAKNRAKAAVAATTAAVAALEAPSAAVLKARLALTSHDTVYTEPLLKPALQSILVRMPGLQRHFAPTSLESTIKCTTCGMSLHHGQASSFVLPVNESDARAPLRCAGEQRRDGGARAPGQDQEGGTAGGRGHGGGAPPGGHGVLPGEQGRVPGVRVLDWRVPPHARSLAVENARGRWQSCGSWGEGQLCFLAKQGRWPGVQLGALMRLGGSWPCLYY